MDAIYAYGPHCCLGRYADAEDFAKTVKAAYAAGYGFVVRYEGIKRVIMAWDCSFVDLEDACARFKSDPDMVSYLQAYSEKGNKLFVIAPTPEGQNVFPFREFDALEKISASTMQSLLK